MPEEVTETIEEEIESASAETIEEEKEAAASEDRERFVSPKKSLQAYQAATRSGL